MGSQPTIHRMQGTAIPVNAYLIESANGVVLVDSMLTVDDGRAIRARIAEIGKPLLAAVVTHAHPDHYGGMVEAVGEARVPIVAAAGVEQAIRRDDPQKEPLLRPMFGDQWPRRRVFPNQVVPGGASVTFDDVTMSLVDLGPGESPHDSLWAIDGADVIFVGDLVYNRMHCYLADGFYERWLDNLERARDLLRPETVLLPGHGDEGSLALLDWQATYIRTFLEAVRTAKREVNDEALVTEVTRRMQELLPTEDLLVLMQLSVPAIAAGLTIESKAQPPSAGTPGRAT